jgi:hypothetical protein
LPVELDERHAKFLGQHAPSVDLPAPRRPMSAMRPSRPLSAGVAPSASASALRARASAASSRPRSISRMRVHSPSVADSSPTSSAIEQPSASRQVAQQHDRCVALASLQVGEMPLGHAGGFGQPLARHCAAKPNRAHPLSKRGEVGSRGSTS